MQVSVVNEKTWEDKSDLLCEKRIIRLERIDTFIGKCIQAGPKFMSRFDEKSFQIVS